MEETEEKEVVGMEKEFMVEEINKEDGERITMKLGKSKKRGRLMTQ